MNSFFKNNFYFFLITALCVVFLVLSSVWSIFLVLSMAGFFSLSVIFCIKFYKKYKLAKSYDESNDYFDARHFDYEEDIYFIGTQNSAKKQIKNKFAEVEALAPFIICLFFSAGFLFMTIYSITTLVF